MYATTLTKEEPNHMARRPISETSVEDKDAERRLVRLQRSLAKAEHTRQERNALLDTMSRAGYTQHRLAALINVANAAEGASLISTDAVFKALKRTRSKADA